MNETWLIILAAVGVLIIGVGLVIIMQLTFLGKLIREQRNEAPRPTRDRPQPSPEESFAPPVDLGARKQGAQDQKKLFKEFINERPEILKEPKKTQFEEFRQWRETHGL